jgi:hypothetical protein
MQYFTWEMFANLKKNTMVTSNLQTDGWKEFEQRGME